MLGGLIQIWDWACKQPSTRGIPHLNFGAEPWAIDIAAEVEAQKLRGRTSLVKPRIHRTGKVELPDVGTDNI
jgi:hypothetical protein